MNTTILFCYFSPMNIMIYDIFVSVCTHTTITTNILYKYYVVFAYFSVFNNYVQQTLHTTIYFFLFLFIPTLCFTTFYRFYYDCYKVSIIIMIMRRNILYY